MLRLMLVMTTLLFAGSAFGKAQGVDSRASFETVGCGSAVTGEQLGCHLQDADAALPVTIEGPVQIDPGPQGFGSYTVSIPVDFQNLMGAGMNVAIGAPNSTGCMLERLAPVNMNQMGFPPEPFDANNRALSHLYSGDGFPSTLVGVWSYQFLVLNCQTPGPLLLLAAMNAFDGSGDELGEIWNKTQLDVSVPEPGPALLAATALTALAMRRSQRASSRPAAPHPA